MLRGLTYFWKINLAVLAAAAINTAVLAGALIVGDSVRGSLRDMTLDRLGDTDQALVAERFFPADLADRLAGGEWASDSQRTIAPAILLPGSAVHTDTGARASAVNVHGIDARFLDLFPQAFGFARQERQFFPSAVINQTLSRQLDIEVGDAMLLSFRTRDNVPDDTLLGNKENVAAFGTLRTVVVEVIPDVGVGRFGLSPSQAFPANAFVSLADLQSAVDQEGAANALFISLPDAAHTGAAPPAAELAGQESADRPGEALQAVMDLEDLGLLTRVHEGQLLLESTEFVLRPPTVETIERAAGAIGARSTRVTSYLATELAANDRSIPYSTVAALAGPAEDLSSLTLTTGGTAPAPVGNEILLNEWTAAELAADIGDTLRVEYYVVGPYEELETESTDFTVAGVVAMTGLGADRRLTPDYPGIESTDNIADWDPPFPVDLSAVRTQDEDYWDEFGATPKVFIGEETAASLWSTRYGSVTSMRMTPPAGTTPEAFEIAFAEALHARLNLPQFGMRFLPVREDGLRASAGATDFSGLFIGFSLFLIASAAILVGLLFSLGIEARAGEVGLLLAVGYSVKTVRRRMLAEGGIVGAAGAMVGLVAAVGYAALMMAGLRTLWLPAVGTPMLTLHLEPLSLVAGWSISVLVVLGSIAGTVRRLGKVPATSLLKGAVFRLTGASPGRRRLRRGLAIGGTLVALSMLVVAIATDSTMDPMVFGTIGFPLLLAGLAAFVDWCRSAHGRLGSPGSTAVWAMAARNSAWSPGRSILSVALVAFAAFVIVTVAANHRDPTKETQSRTSGTGGFALFATAEIPLHQDLNSADDRFDLGFSAADEEALADARFISLRSLPGDDASCLNLYRPQSPSLLGVNGELVARGGFRFATALPPEDSGAAPGSYDPANPWTLLYQDFGPGVVPVIGDANSVQWILHLGLGDDLIVTDEMGEPLSLRVVGTLAESVFRSELLIAEEHLLAHFPGQSGYSTFLVDLVNDADGGTGASEVADDEAIIDRRGAVLTALERALGPYGFDAQPTDEKLAAFLVVQNTYLSTFQLLGGLGLLLGTVGLGVVLVRNVIERRGELATLRAFGFRRASLSYMVLAENAFLLCVGTGIGSAAALAAVAPRFVGGAFSLPWGSLGLILAGVLVAGMVSSIAAVSGALRVPLLPALKGDR